MNVINLPLVSIIIVNYNGLRFLKDCFDSLKKITYPNYEIIFVDNASFDKSVDFVSANYPFVRIVNNQNNLGFCIANNEASHLAKGEYLFFLNNDTKVDSQVVTMLVEQMERDNSTGICGCKIMSYDGSAYFHTGLGIDIFGYPIANYKVFYVEGSSLMIKKALFHQLGGFDEKYFFFHEDIDLAWRVWLAGFKVTALPEAIIYHVYSGTAGGKAIKKGGYSTTYFRRYLSERNNIRTLLKNYSLKSLAVVIPLYLILNLGEILLFLVNLRFKAIFCYLRAYYWNIVNLGDTISKRRKVQNFRKVEDGVIREMMYNGSAKIAIFKKTGIPKFNFNN